MEQKFKKWLIKLGYKSGTINSYSRAINKISKHYSMNSGKNIDLYSLTDQKTISEIAHDYKQTGKFSEFGYESHSLYRAAISRYSEFFVNKDKQNDIKENKEVKEPIETESSQTNFAYERDLQTALCAQISELFPNYKIYGESNIGVEFSINGRRIDILLEQIETGDLLAVELKSGIADYKVFGLISMYLGLLQNKFPDKTISGVIVAGIIDDSLRQASEITDRIELKVYRMSIELENA